MGQPDDIYGVEGKRIDIGLSAIVGITAIPYQSAVNIKMQSGGTLTVGGATLSWGIGYLMDAGETVFWNGRASFYMAATGSTCTVYLFRGGTSNDFGA